jgi:hypothetical protein
VQINANTPNQATIQPSGGEPLAPDIRRNLERNFGADLRSVRVHTDTRAQNTARGMAARAFTIGTNIFLGPGERPTDLRLLAHEVAHVVQQRSAPTVQRWSFAGGDHYEREAQQASAAALRHQSLAVRERTTPRPQRLGISDALDYFADAANNIPGFSMLTFVLGFNPINMRSVERNATNLFRAIIGFLPGGNLIFQALQRHGIIDQVGGWLQQQLNTLGMAASSLRQALDRFLDSLGWSDIFDLGGVWDRAKRIFTEPIDRIISFLSGVVSDILRFIRDAILRPVARLAEGTRAYDLMRLILGRDPITGDPYPRTAENMIGGFMRLIGQEEKWQHLQQSRAIPRAWAWFQQQVSTLLGFVQQIPQLFVQLWESLQVSDLLDIGGAFNRVRNIFGGFVGSFISWAGEAALQIMMFIFEMLAPGAMPVLRRAASVMRIIISEPIRFVGNLVRAGLRGFQQFRDNIRTHLINGLVGWLTGALAGAGLQLPSRWDLRGILSLVLQILGLTWQNIRQKLVRVLGETTVTVLERTFDIVVTLVREGPMAAWQRILENLSNLQETIFSGIRDWVIRTIVGQAVIRIVSMLNPAGAVIQAIIAIYNTIMFFRERLQQIIQVAEAFFNSIAQIASGAIGAAANYVERTMARLVPVVISFLARLIGLGGISNTIRNIIARIRAPIDRALDRVVDWIAAQARRLGRAVAQIGVPQDPNERLRLATQAAAAAARRLTGRVTQALLNPILQGIKLRYGLRDLQPYEQGGTWWVRATINPTVNQNLGVPANPPTATPAAPAQVAVGTQIQLAGSGGGWRPYPYQVTAVTATHIQYRFVGTDVPRAAVSGGLSPLNEAGRLWRLFSPQAGDLPQSELLTHNGGATGTNTSWSDMRIARKVLNHRHHDQQINPAGKEWEHVIEQSAGGPNSVNNLALADATINRDLGTWFGQRQASAPGFPNTGPLTVRQFLDEAHTDAAERRRWKMRAYAIYGVTLRPTTNHGRGPYRKLD